MQRKGTRQSPAANAAERRFIAIVKQLPCCVCGQPGPSIADHIWGSSKKLYAGIERVHVGHWAIVPLCQVCDQVKTFGSRRAFQARYGSQASYWLRMVEGYQLLVPENVKQAIEESECTS